MGLAAAEAGENICWMLGKVPSLTRGKVVYSTTHRYYNIEKVSRSFSCALCDCKLILIAQARRVLGYEPIVGLQEGIKRAVAWYKQDEQEKATVIKA